MTDYFTQVCADLQANLDEAKAAFLKAGGQVHVIQNTPPGPIRSITDNPEVVATIRAHSHLGVIAAAKAVRLGTPTVNKIAKRNGITFSTNTKDNQGARRTVLVPLIRRLSSEGASQAAAAASLGINRHFLRRLAAEEGIAFTGDH